MIEPTTLYKYWNCTNIHAFIKCAQNWVKYGPLTDFDTTRNSLNGTFQCAIIFFDNQLKVFILTLFIIWIKMNQKLYLLTSQILLSSYNAGSMLARGQIFTMAIENWTSSTFELPRTFCFFKLGSLYLHFFLLVIMYIRCYFPFTLGFY